MNKRKRLATVVIAGILSLQFIPLSNSVEAWSAQEANYTLNYSTKVYINELNRHFRSLVISTNGIDYLQAREAVNALNATLSWEPKTKKMTIKKDVLTIIFSTNSKLATVNGKNVILQAAPITYKNTTMLPLSFFSDTMQSYVAESKSDYGLDAVYIEEDNAMYGKTKRDIVNAYLKYAPKFPEKESPYAEKPQYSASGYAPGSLNPQFLNDGLSTIKFYRELAGLSTDVTLKPVLTTRAQYASVLLARLDHLDHRPAKPDDMPQEFYDIAYAGTSSSNIVGGYPTLHQSIHAFMLDSGDNNLLNVGHRRWILNPAMKVTGLGFADNFGDMVTFSEFEKDIPTGEEMITFPFKGYFPSNFMKGYTPWSIHVFGDNYMLNPVDITITITRESDKKVWNINQNDTAGPDKKYMNISTIGYGYSDAIIFRPDGIESYGTDNFSVKVKGVKTKNGEDFPIEYNVNFFELGQKTAAIY